MADTYAAPWEQPVGEPQYASFGKRFLAALIDGLIWFTVHLLLLLIFNVPLTRGSCAITLVEVVLFWLYYAGMESSSKQATLGKMILGLVVTRQDGKRMTFLRATGRYWAKNLSAIPLYLGFIMALFTPRKQALHDIIADTIVVVAPQAQQ